jgi:hypothetical protein
MKNKQELSLITVIIAVAAVVAIGVIYKTQPVRAFNPQPDPPGYGLVGVTAGQTVRIGVINTGDPPDPDTNPARVVLTFKDASGHLFRNADNTPIRRIVLLRGGESASLALNADDFARLFDGSGRLQLRPVVQIQPADDVNGAPPDPCVPSVEVINNANSRTQFMMPFVAVPQRATQPQ